MVYRRPIITLHGANGDKVTFDGVGDAFTLKPGMTGTGLPPRELSHLDLPGGGSVVQHKRWERRPLLFPLDVHTGDYGELEVLRRRVERLVASGPTEIEIYSEVTGSRSIVADYKSGLEGDFSWARRTTSQPMAIEFEAADPMFYGSEVEHTFAVTGQRKPFITGLTPDAIRHNLALNPGGEYASPRYGSFTGADAQSIAFDAGMKASGSRSLRVTAGEGTGTPHILTPATSPLPAAQELDLSGGAVDGAGPQPAPKPAMPQFFTVTMAAQVAVTDAVTHVRVSCWQLDTYWKPVGGSSTHRAGTDWRRITHTTTGLIDAPILFQIQLLRSVGGQLRDVPPGESMWLDEVLIEPGPEAGPYFDGDTTAAGRAYEWVAGPGSASIEQAVATTGALPFFPIRLSSSTVAGEHVITIDADEPVQAIATIAGPGRDVQISRGDEHISITGEIREPITIDSREHHYDVFDASGDLWDRVDGEPSVLHLTPGTHRLKLSMVAATPQSSIRLTYRPPYHAGH